MSTRLRRYWVDSIYLRKNPFVDNCGLALPKQEQVYLAADVEALEAERDQALERLGAWHLQYGYKVEEAAQMLKNAITYKEQAESFETKAKNFEIIASGRGDEVERLADALAAKEAEARDWQVLLNKRDTLQAELARYKADYQRIIMEVLACNPLPASSRSDDQLEPPWEVIARMRAELARCREALEQIAKHTKDERTKAWATAALQPERGGQG